MKLTILYDNTVAVPGFTGDWGFSCLVEAHGKTILFDTGAKGEILLDHMGRLGVDPGGVDAVVVSHDHWDHTGGLKAFLDRKQAPVYVPDVCREPSSAREVVRVRDPIELFGGLFSTGELRGVEQSLLVRTELGVGVVVGCSHSGVENILEAASAVGPPRALVGGLHGFDALDLLKDLELICPTHCTQHASEIRARFPRAFAEGGAGRVIEWPPR